MTAWAAGRCLLPDELPRRPDRDPEPEEGRLAGCIREAAGSEFPSAGRGELGGARSVVAELV
jgi:hypothetical protein